MSYGVTYMWNLKSDSNRFKWTYLQNRNKLRDIEKKLTVAKGERREGIY